MWSVKTQNSLFHMMWLPMVMMSTYEAMLFEFWSSIIMLPSSQVDKIFSIVDIVCKKDQVCVSQIQKLSDCVKFFILLKVFVVHGHTQALHFCVFLRRRRVNFYRFYQKCCAHLTTLLINMRSIFHFDKFEILPVPTTVTVRFSRFVHHIVVHTWAFIHRNTAGVTDVIKDQAWERQRRWFFCFVLFFQIQVHPHTFTTVNTCRAATAIIAAEVTCLAGRWVCAAVLTWTAAFKERHVVRTLPICGNRVR